VEKGVYLSVVVPAYNEERNIVRTANALNRYLRAKGVAYEIIIVDDGSQDATAREVLSLLDSGIPLTLLRNDRNRGKGFTVRRGMLAAEGEYLFFMDADLSYPVEDLDLLLDALDSGYDLCIGSRELPGSRMEARPPLYRHLAGRAYSLLVQLFVVRGIADTQCGFKGFRRRAARDLFSRLTLDDFAFDVELLFLARKLGYSIQIIPARLISSDRTSTVHLIKDSCAMALDLLKIRANELRGVYDA
jgi:dolichyl-phosphate beta-glucosyltransferase